MWRAVWRSGISEGFDRRSAKTVMPVPPGTALHQLYSVPPTGRAFGSGGVCGLDSWSGLDMLKKKIQNNKKSMDVDLLLFS